MTFGKTFLAVFLAIILAVIVVALVNHHAKGKRLRSELNQLIIESRRSYP